MGSLPVTGEKEIWATGRTGLLLFRLRFAGLLHCRRDGNVLRVAGLPHFTDVVLNRFFTFALF
jgi:hypothetical protein